MHNRREFMQTMGAGLLGLSVASSVLPAYADKQSDAALSLGSLGQKKNILFGFALNDKMLADPAYAGLVARQCTIVTPENATKWEFLHPSPTQYTFSRADAIAAFAQSHSIKLRGHCFCWHRGLPPWVTRGVTKSNAEAVLREHIATVAGHYKGKVHSWDVVNEAIHLNDNQPNGWRKSFWYNVLGPSYIDIAYEAAREADPNAILTYNDWGLEYENHADNPKRKAVLEMLRDLKKRNVPVGALGIQSHLRAGTGEKFGYGLPDFIDAVHDLGMQVFVTELDVDDSRFGGEEEDRDDVVADVYKRYLDLVLGTQAVPVVITWGAWDIPRVTGAVAVSGPKAKRPLLFEVPGTPKRAAFSVARCFDHAKTQR